MDCIVINYIFFYSGLNYLIFFFFFLSNLGSFFTERYIPYSEDYLIALQDSDLSMRAGNMDGRKYLVIHGTADTEVHPQHSLILAKSLIQEGVLFRHQVSFFLNIYSLELKTQSVENVHWE